MEAEQTDRQTPLVEDNCLPGAFRFHDCYTGRATKVDSLHPAHLRAMHPRTIDKRQNGHSEDKAAM